jgi:hypothetical protein
MPGMEKFDARKLPRDAQDEMRRQAMRMREELKLSWIKQPAVQYAEFASIRLPG